MFVVTENGTNVVLGVSETEERLQNGDFAITKNGLTTGFFSDKTQVSQTGTVPADVVIGKTQYTAAKGFYIDATYDELVAALAALGVTK